MGGILLPPGTPHPQGTPGGHAWVTPGGHAGDAEALNPPVAVSPRLAPGPAAWHGECQLALSPRPCPRRGDSLARVGPRAGSQHRAAQGGPGLAWCPRRATAARGSVPPACGHCFGHPRGNREGPAPAAWWGLGPGRAHGGTAGVGTVWGPRWQRSTPHCSGIRPPHCQGPPKRGDPPAPPRPHPCTEDPPAPPGSQPGWGHPSGTGDRHPPGCHSDKAPIPPCTSPGGHARGSPKATPAPGSVRARSLSPVHPRGVPAGLRCPTGPVTSPRPRLHKQHVAKTNGCSSGGSAAAPGTRTPHRGLAHARGSGWGLQGSGEHHDTIPRDGSDARSTGDARATGNSAWGGSGQ